MYLLCSLEEKTKSWAAVLKSINNEHASHIDHCSSTEANISSLIKATEVSEFNQTDLNMSLKELNVADLTILNDDEKADLERWGAELNGYKNGIKEELKEKLENMQLEVILLFDFIHLFNF